MTVPNWKAERYLLGELPENEMAALKVLDGENGEFHNSLEQLRNSNEELLAKYPAKKTTEKMLANARKFTVIEPIKNKWIIPISACAALLCCATVLLSLLSNDNMSLQNTVAINEDGTRVKGMKTDLEIWRKTGDSAEKLLDNSLAKAGDLLQLRYAVPEQCYGVLLSLDGNGVLTVHLTGERGKAAQLQAGKVISLENAYELDDAKKFETFYLFTSGKEFALAPIAENLLNGKLPKDLQVTQVTLKKR